MLELIRRCSNSIVVKIFLTILAGSFFLFFGFSFIVDKLTGRDYVVKIGSLKISPQYFKIEKAKRISVLQRQSNEDINEQEISSNILHQLIWENVINQTASNFGIIVSDTTMYNYISGLDMFRRKDGHFSAEDLRRFLAAMQMPEAAFLESKRRDVKMHLMQAPANYISLIDELDSYVDISSEKRSLKFVSINPASLKVTQEPTEDELREFYTANSEELMIPEKRSFVLLEIPVSEIEEKVLVTMEEVADWARDAGEEDIEKFTKSDEYLRLKQEKAQYMVSDAARQIEDALVSGTPVEEVAKTNKLRTLEVKDVVIGDTDKINRPYANEIMIAAFGLEDKEVGSFTESQDEKNRPVQWMVFIKDISPRHVEAFEKARPQVEVAWRKDQQRELALSLAQKIATAVTDSGMTFEKATSAERYKVAKTSLFSREGQNDDKKNGAIIEALYEEAFEKEKNSVSYREVDDRMIVYQVDQVQHDSSIPVEEKQKRYVELHREISSDILQQIVTHQSRELKVEINNKTLKEIDDNINVESIDSIL